MFIELFRADNDVILFINSEPSEIKHMIDVVEEAVHEGVIPEERIDRSVRRILRAKGLRVVG
ncbi:hypothetical protein COY95_03795 [Candidatus Woesearchaeota archaeon CG_4_10_14_0_8_um_filter_47_5]|nr:MAG: hypothetical protein COY95_03795 [Candidatus Woesearchaeota archaeon CG_4_10_14_0_8_um_filter_47_5]